MFDLPILREQILNTLIDLATDEGINASSKEEIFGCIFGRDSALTILKMLRVYQRNPDERLLDISRRALLTLVRLQGQEFNIESNEEPGKFIHEYRKDKFEHLRKRNWFIYPDGLLKNYDSIDSTPLSLIAIYKYWEITQDEEFLKAVSTAVEMGLNWVITFGDIDKDYLIEYEFKKDRKHSGLKVQSWTDSHESLLQSDGQMPSYPIAPVEAQAYSWLALKLWAEFYEIRSGVFARKLDSRANQIKQRFNELFIFRDNGFFFAAQALDGYKKQIKTITANPLIALWASLYRDGKKECILGEEYLLDIVNRAFQNDLFDPEAGIRTMSVKSPTFDPSQNSYHNGSFWPVLNGLVHEGLEKWGFEEYSNLLKKASLNPIQYFGTPIELYVKNSEGVLVEYRSSSSGQVGCRQQAWSAAAALDWLT